MWIASRIARWARTLLARWGSALVVEADGPDGTRLLIGLDAGWCGAPLVAALATHHPGDARDDRDLGDVVVLDDLRDLVV